LTAITQSLSNNQMHTYDNDSFFTCIDGPLKDPQERKLIMEQE